MVSAGSAHGVPGRRLALPLRASPVRTLCPPEDGEHDGDGRRARGRADERVGARLLRESLLIERAARPLACAGHHDRRGAGVVDGVHAAPEGGRAERDGRAGPDPEEHRRDPLALLGLRLVRRLRVIRRRAARRRRGRSDGHGNVCGRGRGRRLLSGRVERRGPPRRRPWPRPSPACPSTAAPLASTNADATVALPGSTEPLMGARSLNVESAFNYGSRVGFWEIMRLLQTRQLDATVYAVGLALERNAAAAAAIAASGFEVACHGQRWIDYHAVPEAVERADMERNIETVTRLIGRRPVGWYTGRQSANTRRLVSDSGGFLYDSDAYDDDLPYWTQVGGKPHLVLPYSLDNNDSRLQRGGISRPASSFFAIAGTRLTGFTARGWRAVRE